jgi:hypothetical protein
MATPDVIAAIGTRDWAKVRFLGGWYKSLCRTHMDYYVQYHGHLEKYSLEAGRSAIEVAAVSV